MLYIFGPRTSQRSAALWHRHLSLKRLIQSTLSFTVSVTCCVERREHRICWSLQTVFFLKVKTYLFIFIRFLLLILWSDPCCQLGKVWYMHWNTKPFLIIFLFRGCILRTVFRCAATVTNIASVKDKTPMWKHL